MRLSLIARFFQKMVVGSKRMNSSVSGGSPSPYDNLPAERFWRTGVALQNPFCIQNLYTARLKLTREHRIACAGSCFAQHISAQLRSRNYQVIDKEPLPPGLTKDNGLRFGYGVFSARFANIYVTRQLLQLAEEALLNKRRTPDEIAWETQGRFFDALRPSVEPEGFSTVEELLLHRAVHIKKVREMFLEMDVFIFTLGLTECWENSLTGLVYPTCPGTIAGSFDTEKYRFRNLTFSEIYNDFVAFKKLIHAKNPAVKFILTVSPVPLTATATAQHVLAATTFSKSTLRAVAGELYHSFPEIDYFPSYEIITGPQSKGRFYESNLRSILPDGVCTVMNHFFAQQPSEPCQIVESNPEAVADDVVCEEAMLEAFSKT
jgi:hypothetical protein